MAPTLLADDEEAELAGNVRRDSISKHKYCPPKLVMQQPFYGTNLLIQRTLQTQVIQKRSARVGDGGINSRTNGASDFSGNLAPRLDAQFLADIAIALEEYPRDRILNADETSWKIGNNRTAQKQLHANSTEMPKYAPPWLQTATV
jgi:hypothetical protein